MGQYLPVPASGPHAAVPYYHMLASVFKASKPSQHDTYSCCGKSILAKAAPPQGCLDAAKALEMIRKNLY